MTNEISSQYNLGRIKEYLPLYLKKSLETLAKTDKKEENVIPESVDEESVLDLNPQKDDAVVSFSSTTTSFAAWIGSFFGGTSSSGAADSSSGSGSSSDSAPTEPVDVTTGPTKYEDGVLTFKNDTKVEVPQDGKVVRNADGSAIVTYKKDEIDYKEEYNSEGQLISRTVKNSEGKSQTDKYEYDKDGKVTSSTTTVFDKDDKQIFKLSNKYMKKDVSYTFETQENSPIISGAYISFLNGTKIGLKEGDSAAIASDGTVTVLKSNPEDTDLSSVVTTYDTKGREIERLETLKTGETRNEKKKYDSAGAVVSQSKTDESGKITTTTITYDAKGNPQETVSIKDGNKTITKYYTTDKKGRNVEVIETSENGKVTRQETTFEKDGKKHGRAKETVITNADGSTETIKYNYNDKEIKLRGKTVIEKYGTTLKSVKKVVKASNGKKTTTTEKYSYDEKGNLSEVVVKQGNKKTTYAVTNGYDSQGNIISQTITNNKNSASKVTTFDWNNLDEDGQPTETIVERPVVSGSKITFATGEIVDISNAADYTINDDGSVTVTDEDGNKYKYQSTKDVFGNITS